MHVGPGRNAVFDFVANWTVVAGAMIGVWGRGVRGARGGGSAVWRGRRGEGEGGGGTNIAQKSAMRIPKFQQCV